MSFDMEVLVRNAFKQVGGRKLTFAELKQRSRIRRGLVRLLDQMKQAGDVDYELDNKGMMTNETVISCLDNL